MSQLGVVTLLYPEVLGLECACELNLQQWSTIVNPSFTLWLERKSLVDSVSCITAGDNQKFHNILHLQKWWDDEVFAQRRALQPARLQFQHGQGTGLQKCVGTQSHIQNDGMRFSVTGASIMVTWTLPPIQKPQTFTKIATQEGSHLVVHILLICSGYATAHGWIQKYHLTWFSSSQSYGMWVPTKEW
jgi:hypothetical protein